VSDHRTSHQLFAEGLCLLSGAHVIHDPTLRQRFL
jgi:hypothetical protein